MQSQTVSLRLESLARGSRLMGQPCTLRNTDGVMIRRNCELTGAHPDLASADLSIPVKIYRLA